MARSSLGIAVAGSFISTSSATERTVNQIAEVASFLCGKHLLSAHVALYRNYRHHRPLPIVRFARYGVTGPIAKRLVSISSVT